MSDKNYLIPMNKAVTGADILRLTESLNISYDESHWLFGVCVNTWTKIVRDGLNSIVTNPTVALLAKYYSHKPENVPIPHKVSFKDVHTASETPKIQYIGALLGKEKVTAHRWSKDNEKGMSFSPPVQRLANHLVAECEEGNLAWWEMMVESEAKSRGATNIFSDTNWNTPVIKDQYNKTSLVTRILQAVERVESDCAKEFCYLDDLGFDLEQRDIDTIVKENFEEIKDNVSLTLKSLKDRKKPVKDKVKELVELFAPYPKN
jgi:hypothetical protein